MKFYALILCFFLGNFKFIYGQNDTKLDSLLSVYKNQPDGIPKIETLEALFYQETYTDPQKGENYARKAVSISEKINYELGRNIGLYHIGVSYILRQNADSAKFYYNQALVNFEKTDEPDNIAMVLDALGGIKKMEGAFTEAIQMKEKASNIYLEQEDYLRYGISIGEIGSTYMEKGNYKIALQKSLEALKIIDTIQEQPWRKADILRNIGRTEHFRKNYKEAIGYFKEALRIYLETNDKLWEGYTYYDIGSALLELKEQDQARDYFNKSLDIGKSLDIPDMKANAYGSLAMIFTDNEQYTKAIEYVDITLKIHRKINSITNEIFSLREKGRILTEMGKYNEALTFLNLSVKKADSIEAIDLSKIAYESRSETYEQNNQMKKALEDRKQYQLLNDSIFNKTKSQQIEELKIIYETEKKEAAIALQKEEIKNLNQQVEISNLRKTLYAGGMISFIAFSGLLFFGFRQRIKRNAIEREKQEEIYKQEIEFKKKELTSQTLHLVQKSSFIQELKENLERIKNSPELFKVEFRRLVMLLKKESAEDKDWEVFKSYFADVHNNFDNKLKSIYSEISEKEIRLASFLRMNLTTKEIATMLNVLPDSVLKSKYRLKKKLNLDKETDLYQFLNTL
ncbi:tetratricopeptide repeat protein [Aquimarina rubra]|uniref:Tetratricopeptide repeat protein n=2 Tax=Aquimarina rubra TaxID=1920033 RepID=A0ABW5LE80_9FLAO